MGPLHEVVEAAVACYGVAVQSLPGDVTWLGASCMGQPYHRLCQLGLCMVGSLTRGLHCPLVTFLSADGPGPQMPCPMSAVALGSLQPPLSQTCMAALLWGRSRLPGVGSNIASSLAPPNCWHHAQVLGGGRVG